jgi:hypothetical protein
MPTASSTYTGAGPDNTSTASIAIHAISTSTRRNWTRPASLGADLRRGGTTAIPTARTVARPRYGEGLGASGSTISSQDTSINHHSWPRLARMGRLRRGIVTVSREVDRRRP